MGSPGARMRRLGPRERTVEESHWGSDDGRRRGILVARTPVDRIRHCQGGGAKGSGGMGEGSAGGGEAAGAPDVIAGWHTPRWRWQNLPLRCGRGETQPPRTQNRPAPARAQDSWAYAPVVGFGDVRPTSSLCRAARRGARGAPSGRGPWRTGTCSRDRTMGQGALPRRARLGAEGQGDARVVPLPRRVSPGGRSSPSGSSQPG